MNKKIISQENEIKKLIKEKINNINKENIEINIMIKNIQDRLNNEVENKIKKYINENNLQKTPEKTNYFQDLLKNAINLKCKCPCKICKSSGKEIQWKCPKCSSDEYINDEARIICPRCGKKEYIWKKKFKCGNHDENYHEISYQGFLVTLSALGNTSNPPNGFLKKLVKNCLLHEDEFLSE